MNYFLDTNIIIYAVKGSFPSIKNHFLNLNENDKIFIPEIVRAELEFGARHSNNYEKTISLYKKFFEEFEIKAFSEIESYFYGILRQQLTSEGRLIGPNDMLIAATALANNGILVTHNTDEFSRINNLKIEDWTK